MSFSMMNAMGDYMAEKPREIVKIDLADIKKLPKSRMQV